MASKWRFPFGEPVKNVVQRDQTPKKVFVLGAYAGTVHARWLGPDHKTRITALAIASEPDVFWQGENAAEIVERVNKKLPPGVGELVEPIRTLNGPSGRVLDMGILEPLGFSRTDAWLCDLVPHSCINPIQERLIARRYTPLIQEFGLPEASIPKIPLELANETRRKEIVAELQQSRAKKLVVLGDLPIFWFLKYFDDQNRTRLADFVPSDKSYGNPVPIKIEGKTYEVIPLVHPRQIARLGKSSPIWNTRHETWRKQRVKGL